MRNSRTVSALIAIAAISLPLLASTASAVAASPRAAPSIGTQLAELKGSDTVAGDRLGHPVAISGTTVVVGAPGHAKGVGRAYVFAKTAGRWKQTAELKGSDTVAGDLFGESVAISGTTVVVGALLHAKGAGRAYVFIGTGAGWTQVAELKGSDTVAGDTFGNSVAISGTTVAVGASGHANNAGRAYVFTKTVRGWKQTAELEGADTVAGDTFGNSVAISGTTAFVGASGHANNAGRAYVFTKTVRGWKQTAELEGSDTVSGDNFGESVAISGTAAVVGAWLHAKSAGRAYVFTKTASRWTQAAELKGSDTVASDEFGSSVAISGTTAIVGAAGHADTAGRAYVFEV
jgi:nucleoside-specific outer membrane channel protein Tsx